MVDASQTHRDTARDASIIAESHRLRLHNAPLERGHTMAYQMIEVSEDAAALFCADCGNAPDPQRGLSVAFGTAYCHNCEVPRRRKRALMASLRLRRRLLKSRSGWNAARGNAPQSAKWRLGGMPTRLFDWWAEAAETTESNPDKQAYYAMLARHSDKQYGDQGGAVRQRLV